MTISSETYKIAYNGNGSTDTFAYTFKILSDDDILVQVKNTTTGVITTLIKTTDYTVTGVGTDAGGNVVLVDPATDAPSGTQIILTRDLDLLQSTDYTEYDEFPAESHETALDRGIMIDQQQQEQIDRTIKMDPAITGIDGQIEGTPAAGNIIQVNSAGDGYRYSSMSEVSGYIFPAGTGLLYQTAAGISIAATLAGTANEVTITESPTGTYTFSLPATINANTTGNAATATNASNADTVTNGVYTTDIGTLVQAWSAVLDATTASFTLADETKLDGIEAGADVTDSANVTTALSGASLPAVPIAADDKVIIKDTSDSGNVKIVTAQSIADLSSSVVIQRVSTQGTPQSGTTTIPYDKTTPQNTEGTQFMSLSITPKNSSNILVIEVAAFLTSSVASSVITGALFQDSGANAIGAGIVQAVSATGGATLNFRLIKSAGTTSATTFYFRAGGNSASIITFSGAGGLNIFGNIPLSYMMITEYSA